MSNKRSLLYTAPGHPAPLTIAQIAAMAACKYSWAHEHIRSGRPIAGHVWTATGDKTPFATGAPRTSRRILLTAEGDPTPRTYADLQRLGGFKHLHTAVIYVSKGTPIAGRVYRTARQVEALHEAPGPSWRKPTSPPSPTPSAAPRRFANAWESVDELLPVNPMRLQAAPDAQGVTL